MSEEMTPFPNKKEFLRDWYNRESCDTPVREAVESIISALDIVATMAIDNVQLEEILRAEFALQTVRTRIHLILNILDAKRYRVPKGRHE